MGFGLNISDSGAIVLPISTINASNSCHLCTSTTVWLAAAKPNGHNLFMTALTASPLLLPQNKYSAKVNVVVRGADILLVTDSELLLGLESGLEGDGMTEPMEVLSRDAISNSTGAGSAIFIFLLTL